MVVEALRHTLWINSKFREDLYANPTISLQDALHRSKNFIQLEEDKRAFFNKQNTAKQGTSKTADTQPEPRQHASFKADKQKGLMYNVSEEAHGATAVVHEPGWNVWERETDEKNNPKAGSSSGQTLPYDATKYCDFQKKKGHDTKECKQLQEALLAAFLGREINIEPTKFKSSKGSKSWSKSKDKKKFGRKPSREPSQDEEKAAPPQHDSASDDENPRSSRKTSPSEPAHRLLPLTKIYAPTTYASH